MDNSGETASPVWDERADLPAEVLACLQQPPGSVVALIATVDPDGAPRTAAFGLVRAVSARQLRLPCRRSHATFANLHRASPVMLALYAAGGIAIGVRGTGRVLREQMRSWPDNALVEVRVESVKNDAHPLLPVTSGIGYAVPDELVGRLLAVSDELLEQRSGDGHSTG